MAPHVKNDARIPLPLLPRELTKHTGKPAPSYRRLYSLTLDGRLPAEVENGRWFVRGADLPAIAAVLGLSLETREPSPATAA